MQTDTDRIDALIVQYLDLLSSAMPAGQVDIHHGMALSAALIISAVALESSFDITQEWIDINIEDARAAHNEAPSIDLQSVN